MATLRIEFEKIEDSETFDRVKHALRSLAGVEVSQIDRETAWLTYDLDDVDLDAIEGLVTRAGAAVKSVHREF